MGLFNFFRKNKEAAPAQAGSPVAQTPDEPRAALPSGTVAEPATVVEPAAEPVTDAGPQGAQTPEPPEAPRQAPESVPASAAEPVPQQVAAPAAFAQAAPEAPQTAPAATPPPAAAPAQAPVAEPAKEPAPVPPSEPAKIPEPAPVFEKPSADKDLQKGLEKTKTGLFAKLARVVAGKSRVDEEMLDELEEILISSDVGVETTVKIIRRIEERVARDKYMNSAELQAILREEIAALLAAQDELDEKYDAAIREGVPFVVMVVGVNGVGKTTTIGKLAAQLHKLGKRVYIGAADTFRAAAIDQLQVWADRAGATMIRQQMGSDPASVAFDTLKSAVANKADVVLIDTAGRLHNKIGLMNELTKIRNVMAKVIPDAPHEVMLVLDGSTGQNAFEQARQFTQATQVTSLAITKLDGTAKGGVVIGISDQFGVPVRYIGVGEGIDQLQIFDRRAFVDALFL